MNAQLIGATKIAVIIFTGLFFVKNLNAQTSVASGANINYPVPTTTNQLFYLQRSSNTNTVIYELNKTNEELNAKSPIHPYWIMYAKDGRHEDLNDIEKKYAYGIKMKTSDGDNYQFALVAYPSIIMKLALGTDHHYHVFTTPSNEPMILNKVFIKTKDGGSKLKPKVEYIEFIGSNPNTGKEIVNRITP